MKLWMDFASRGLICCALLMVGISLSTGCQKKTTVVSGDQTTTAVSETTPAEAPVEEEFNLEELEVDILSSDSEEIGAATTGDDFDVSSATTGSDFSIETDATTGSSFSVEPDSATTGDEGGAPVDIEVIEEEGTETTSIETSNQVAFFFNV